MLAAFPGRAAADCPPKPAAYITKPAARDPGGWHTTPHYRARFASDSDRCDIDVREGLTPQEFLVEYLSLNKPVLVRGATTGACGFTRGSRPADYCLGSLWDALRGRWRRVAFMKHFGHLQFPSASLPYAA
jgi:hypothetical protein